MPRVMAGSTAPKYPASPSVKEIIFATMNKKPQKQSRQRLWQYIPKSDFQRCRLQEIRWSWNTLTTLRQSILHHKIKTSKKCAQLRLDAS